MKILGIDISGSDVRMVALDGSNGEILNYTGKYKPLKFEDDENADNVKLFKNTLFATIKGYAPDVIIYNHRKATGKYAGSPISFKIECLIQLYENVTIDCTKAKTLSTFYEKNELPIACDYKYQTDALKIGYHYLQVN